MRRTQSIFLFFTRFIIPRFAGVSKRWSTWVSNIFFDIKISCENYYFCFESNKKVIKSDDRICSVIFFLALLNDYKIVIDYFMLLTYLNNISDSIAIFYFKSKIKEILVCQGMVTNQYTKLKKGTPSVTSNYGQINE